MSRYFVKAHGGRATALFNVSDNGMFANSFDKTTLEWTYREGLDVIGDMDTWQVDEAEAKRIEAEFKAGADSVEVTL